ncbi:MAG: hypothetical protein ABII00_19225 [Elusimicrobiota bacterium]
MKDVLVDATLLVGLAFLLKLSHPDLKRAGKGMHDRAGRCVRGAESLKRGDVGGGLRAAAYRREGQQKSEYDP